MQILINAGATINLARSSKCGVTPLHVASENGHTDAMDVLIEAGAVINQADKDGFSSLFGTHR